MKDLTPLFPETYLQRFRYLNALDMAPGVFDMSNGLPAEPLTMLAPHVELLANKNFSPALIDVLTDAAKATHSQGTLLQKPGEFPSLVQDRWPISEEALRYNKDGKNFLYYWLPFWLASLISRALHILAPLLILSLPIIPVIPKVISWQIESRIYRRYQDLVTVEQEMLGSMTPERYAFLSNWLNDIEKSIINTRIQGAYTQQLYWMRQHLLSIRSRLDKIKETASEEQANA